jgi:hypothetical protein
MKTLTEHIHHVRKQPHHVKKRVVFTVSGALTGAIAFLWLLGNLWQGSFALPNTSFADAQPTPGLVVSGSAGADSLLAGAAASISTGPTSGIQIIDTKQPTIIKDAEPTVIPF